MKPINFSQEKEPLLNCVRGKKRMGECKITTEWQEVEEKLATNFCEAMTEFMF